VTSEQLPPEWCDPYVRPLPRHVDNRGRLSWIEGENLPFDVRRVYYLDSASPGVVRGEHAHKALQQVMVALGGDISVDVADTSGNFQRFTLQPFEELLYIPPAHWRRVMFESPDATCLVLASEVFDENDYIRDFDEFLRWASWT
jgi:dTDP-4-dehydrorhamnose 3,5-epimerase-like enzyme